MIHNASRCKARSDAGSCIPFNSDVLCKKGHFQEGYANFAHAVPLTSTGSYASSQEQPSRATWLALGHWGRPRSPSMPPVRATQAISRMRGGSQSQLMLGDDGNLWVVKFQNNPQHLKVLANELIATRIAAVLGLSVPKRCVIDVGPWLIESNPQLTVDHGRRGREMCASGLQFGSQYAGGKPPQRAIDFLPDDQLQKALNLSEFAGMLAFDKWTGNCDGRQAVFQRCKEEGGEEGGYRVVFIDQGGCFNTGEWIFRDAPLQGVYARNSVYSLVTGWDSFEPWLSRIEQLSPDVLWGIAETVPPEWYGGDGCELRKLVEKLISRRPRVRELIDQFRQSSGNPFPYWKNMPAVLPNRRAPYRRKVLYAMVTGVSPAVYGTHSA